MPQYEYQGINAQGKSVKGSMIAESLLSAKSHLRREGVFPSHIAESHSAALEKGSKNLSVGGFFKSVPIQELAIMTRQLATLVASHIPLVESLEALTEQVEQPRLRAAIAQVKSDVNEGMNFSKALGRFPDIFSDLFVNMVAAGESSGALDIVLLRLADFLEYQDRLKKKVSSSMAYPILMIVVGFTAILLIFTLVIPQIETIFIENKQTLPLITQVVLAISRFLIGWWWALLILVAVILFSIRKFLKSEFGRNWWDRIQLKLPIFGDLVRMISVSRFTKTLSTLLKSGIPLLTGLSIVKNVVGNRTILKAIEQATTDLTEGQNISDPLRRSGQFPPLVTHMISVGERTGELENMLEKVSEHYEYQVNARIQSFTSLIEPLMIVFLAGMVLVIVLSVILPMIEMNNSVM